MKNVRSLLMVGIGLSIAALVWRAYETGLYVGGMQLRKQAMDAGAGHYDLFRSPSPWIWTPDPKWKPPDQAGHVRSNRT